MNLHNLNKLVCSHYEKYKHKCHTFSVCTPHAKHCVLHSFEHDGWTVQDFDCSEAALETLG